MLRLADIPSAEELTLGISFGVKLFCEGILIKNFCSICRLLDEGVDEEVEDWGFDDIVVECIVDVRICKRILPRGQRGGGSGAESISCMSSGVAINRPMRWWAKALKVKERSDKIKFNDFGLMCWNGS